MTSDNNEKKIRIVVATSALGCGVNMKNVRHIIHFDPVFHGSRDKNEDLCNAVLYNFSKNRGHISKSMKKYIADS